jgi:hypothetical protein
MIGCKIAKKQIAIYKEICWLLIKLKNSSIKKNKFLGIINCCNFYITDL